jgi:hypothetical protein
MLGISINDLYDKFGNKIIKNDIKHLPLDKLANFMWGFLGANNIFTKKSHKFYSDSVDMVESIRYILLRMKKMPRVRRNIRFNTKTYKYELEIPNSLNWTIEENICKPGCFPDCITKHFTEKN